MLPPIPKKKPKILKAHGDQRSDDYYWLRDDSRTNKEIIEYLEEEKREKRRNKRQEEWNWRMQALKKEFKTKSQDPGKAF